jgi:hypothetical protein
MAEDNPHWGYGRMYGELRKLGFKVHWQTVRCVGAFTENRRRQEKTTSFFEKPTSQSATKMLLKT